MLIANAIPVAAALSDRMVDTQRVRQSPEHTDTGGHTGTFDRAHVAHANVRACSPLLLRQTLFMAQTTHVGPQDLLDIPG